MSIDPYKKDWRFHLRRIGVLLVVAGLFALAYVSPWISVGVFSVWLGSFLVIAAAFSGRSE